MANGIRIKVIFKKGEPKYHTLDFNLTASEIYGWLNDVYGGYGWEDYIIL